MRTVCSKDGWSPNPADLNCTVGTHAVVVVVVDDLVACYVALICYMCMTGI